VPALYRIPFQSFSGWGGKGNFDDPSLPHGIGQPFAWDFGYLNPYDINNAVGGKIYAARAGTVIDLRWWVMISTPVPGLGAGNYVVIRHADNTVLAYDHLDFNTIAVSLGQYVEQGTFLGIVGNTGNSTGVHLHLEALSRYLPGTVGTEGDETPGNSLLIHFEDGKHEEPWRPIAIDFFVTNPLLYRQDGWHLCYRCASLFFSYQGANGVCPKGGAHVSTGNIYTLSDDIDAPGQPNWKYCKKCRALFWGANFGSRCPASPGIQHDGSGSGDYRIINNVPSDPGQHGWRFCFKCKSMWYGWWATTSVCPYDNTTQHSASGSDDYSLHVSCEDTQRNWRRCSKCFGLFFQPTGGGVCPQDGGAHADLVNLNYTLCVNVSPVNAGHPLAPKQRSVPPFPTGWQADWRYCYKCGLLFFGPNQSISRCPAPGNGRHSGSLSGKYYLFIAASPVANIGGLGEQGWRWCNKCQGLWFPSLAISDCPADGVHTAAGSGNYVLMKDSFA
jgi:peptidase M23-like protein